MASQVGTAVHLTDAVVGSEEWAQARRSRINGSEIAAVLGISPYESPFSLWHRKAGSIGGTAVNDVMYWGTRLEPVIRDEWNLRHPDLVVVDTGQWCHVDRSWQGGSPDGLGNRRLWEGKTAHTNLAWQWGEEGSDEIPVHYRAQTLWYLDVFGFDECDVSVLIGGSDYREYLVRRDEAELALMRDAALAFLDTLTTGQLPALDGHEATYEAVKELHPGIEPTSVELPATIAEPYLDALAAYKDAEQDKRRWTAEVAAFMGPAREAWYGGQKVAAREAKTTEGSLPYVKAARGAADINRSRGTAA